MNKQLLELYKAYLTSSFSYTTATGLSVMSEGKISRDKVTRSLSSEYFTAAKLWETFLNQQTKKEKRVREKTKIKQYQEMLKVCAKKYSANKKSI
jgi:hypothetical protein